MTQGPVAGHVLKLSSFMAFSMLFQTLYFVIDLYFVGRIGKEAVAGVALGGNLTMVVLALTQALGVGATSLLAQSLGRRDRERAEVVFNQTLVFSAIVGAAFFVVMFAYRGAYVRGLAADAATAAHGIAYLDWYIPALTLQFVGVGLGSALRSAGDMKMPMLLQVATVLLNVVLAPVLMFGWGTGMAMGVAGAALASFIAIGAGLVGFVFYFLRASSLLKFQPRDWRPQPRLWGQMLKVGLPVGGEFALTSVYLVLIYSVLKPFGAEAQAGFGIGLRVLQSLFLPAIAIGFAAAPVAGQNFGAGHVGRVQETFHAAARISTIAMGLATLACQMVPGAMVRFFNADPAVVATGVEYLRVVSWSFIASGVIFVASSIFQGLGHTLPALASSATRLVLFAIPVYWLAGRPGFQVRHVWYLSVATIVIHAAASVWLLRRQFRQIEPGKVRSGDV